MKCPHCGEWDTYGVEVDCTNADGERLQFTICRNCDYGINEHTEGECECVR